MVKVNFGSIIVLTPQQMLELAKVLANNKKSFSWIISSDNDHGKFVNLCCKYSRLISNDIQFTIIRAYKT